jgi:Zn-dependent protease
MGTWPEIALAFAVFLFSIVFHETAHGWMAEKLGDPTARLSGRITLNPVPHLDPVGSLLLPAMAFLTHIPFIGWARPVPVNAHNLRKPREHQAWVAAAGPAANLLLILSGMLLLIVVGILYSRVPGLAARTGRSLQFFTLLASDLVLLNAVLALFNLIPLPPLDGHWILERFLPPSGIAFMDAIRPYGFFILIGLLWLGALDWVLGTLVYGIHGSAMSIAERVIQWLG